LGLLVVQVLIDPVVLIGGDRVAVDAADLTAGERGAAPAAEIHAPLEDHETDEGERGDQHDHLRLLAEFVHHNTASPATGRCGKGYQIKELQVNDVEPEFQPDWAGEVPAPEGGGAGEAMAAVGGGGDGRRGRGKGVGGGRLRRSG